MAEIRIADRVEQPFYTPASLARKLSISRSTLYTRYLEPGIIPTYEIAGVTRIDPADVDRVLAKCKRTHTKRRRAA